MQNEIEKEMLLAGGQEAKKQEEQSDKVNEEEDEEKRIADMRDPTQRKFNENDIMGDFDRDEKGNIIPLTDSSGKHVDKTGRAVNERGYIVDEKTGDVLEKEKNRKVFGKEELDERGELPPPFNLERFNFNPHDIRGYFDRDANGNEIITPVDKLGRRVNRAGYLVDREGNIVDKRGRRKLHHKQLTKDGNLPLLFNYKGKKYDIQDVIGDFEKDRQGNAIIRRDKDNNRVDKRGRRVNSKGYLVDEGGNVVN